MNAAWLLTLGGTRTRLGRRAVQDTNVPTAYGFMFGDLEYTAPSEVRSDLYRERDGVTTRLTYGARLLMPDVRHDRTIVAVKVAPTRSSLVLLDTDAHPGRVLREGGPDETWTDPRWSPDGENIVAIHRQHGAFSLEIIDLRSDNATTHRSHTSCTLDTELVARRACASVCER